ncbi:vWA domain-containing protein [Intestinibacter sp.]
MSEAFNFEFEDYDPLEAKPVSKKSMVIFFVIDTSESMKGKKIDDLNKVMRDIMPELVGIGGSNTDMKYAVLSFSSGCKWETSEPLIVDEDNEWKDLKAEGITDMGMAFEELTNMLSRKKFLKSPSLSYAPVIFLMTDGYPTDNYKKGLEKLKANNWYKYGIKIALGIGDYFNESVLEEFTENKELVVKASSSAQLAKLVRTIAVTSSQIGSKSMSIVKDDDTEFKDEDVEKTKEKEMIKTVQETVNDDDFINLEFEDGWD